MAVNIGPKIGIDGEKEYRKQINDLITQQKTFSAEMKELESSFDDSTSAMEKNRKKGELLEKQIKNQEKQVKELEKGLKASQEKYGENAAETNKWRQAVSNARTDLNRMRSELSQIPKGIDKVGKSMQAAGKKMQAVGTAMTKYVTAPLAGLATASVAAFKEVDAGLDIVTKKTGATGEALEALQESARTVATTIPTSFETAGSAIGEVSTKFGLVGDDLEALSTKFVKFADLNDTDVSNSVDKVQKTMAAFGMETDEAGDLLDTLNAVGQATGISMDTLTTSMVKNAAALQGMGMDAHDAAQFLGQVEMSGANTADVMKGMQKAMTEAAEDGMTLPQKLEEFNTVMQSSMSDADKLSIAMETFGTKAGQAIYNAYQEGSLNFENLSQAAEEFSGNIDQTYSDVKGANDSLITSMNKIKSAGSRIGGAVLEAIAPVVDDIADFTESVVGKYTEMDEGQQKFVLAAVAAFGLGGPVVTAFGKTVEAAGKVAVKAGALAGKIGEVAISSSALETAAGALAGATGPIAVLLGTVGWAGYVVYSMTKKVEASDEDIANLIKTQEENLTALDSAMASVNEVLTSGNESIEEINAQEAVALSIIDELEKLEKQSNRTAEEEAHMQVLVDELNQMYPGLKLNIDKSTGSLSKSTTEIRKYVKAAKGMAMLDALTKASSEAMDAFIQANHQLYVAEQGKEDIIKSIAEQRKLYDDMIKANEETPYTYSANELQDVANNIDALTLSLEESETKVEENRAAVAEAEAVYDSWQQQIDDTTESLEEEAKAEEEQGSKLDDNTNKLEENRKAFYERAKTIAEQYSATKAAFDAEIAKWDELYQATKESIEGQVKLFDEWKQDTELTFHDVMKNLNSNIKGMRNYTTNLQRLAEAANKSGDENFKAFVQYIADMGTEGAAVAQALVDEMDRDSENFNRSISKFGKATGAEENLAQILTYIKNDFKTGTEAGSAAFNKAIDEMGNDSVMGQFRSRVQEVWDKSVNIFKKGAQEASDESKKIIDGTDYEPEVDKVLVRIEAVEKAQKEIEDGIKPKVTIAGLDVGTAVANAKATMQDWFNRNPIIAKLSSSGVAHNATGGFVENETLSWIAEGDKPEVVIPLSSSLRTRAIELYEQTGDILGVDSIPRPSSVITMPGSHGYDHDGTFSVGFDADKLYAAVAQGAAAGMESANIRIYWDNREAGRIMRNMGVQFA